MMTGPWVYFVASAILAVIMLAALRLVMAVVIDLSGRVERLEDRAKGGPTS